MTEKWEKIGEVSEITPKLYLSSCSNIDDVGLTKKGINLIINATRDLPHQTKSDAFINIRVPVDDNSEANLSPYFQVNNILKKYFIIV